MEAKLVDGMPEGGPDIDQRGGGGELAPQWR
jgi:hypothetical protein